MNDQDNYNFKWLHYKRLHFGLLLGWLILTVVGVYTIYTNVVSHSWWFIPASLLAFLVGLYMTFKQVREIIYRYRNKLWYKKEEE